LPLWGRSCSDAVRAARTCWRCCATGWCACLSDAVMTTDQIETKYFFLPPTALHPPPNCPLPPYTSPAPPPTPATSVLAL
jgi:hypothetical protein